MTSVALPTFLRSLSSTLESVVSRVRKVAVGDTSSRGTLLIVQQDVDCAERTERLVNRGRARQLGQPGNVLPHYASGLVRIFDRPVSVHPRLHFYDYQDALGPASHIKQGLPTAVAQQGQFMVKASESFVS